MKNRISILTGVAFVFSIFLLACNSTPKSADQKEKVVHEAGCEGEKSETLLSPDQVYDAESKGTHMVLSYDAEAAAFTGTVENISTEVLDRVRVEVHLSNGTELGPTTQVKLAPGEKRAVKLSAAGEDFESWTTHAEVGSGEHSHDGEHEHSHEGQSAPATDEHGHSHEDGGHEHN